MKKTMILIFIVFSLFAGDKNVGFLMNQKYVCINQGALINEKLVPILSKEDALNHPLRIVIDDNNILQTDGAYKNLKHIKETLYGNTEHKIMLFVEKDNRYFIMSSKEMGNIPLLYFCWETDNWTLAN